MNVKKKSVIFVGSFRPSLDGSIGGVMFACRSLMDSPLGRYVHWMEVDVTMRSLPPPSLPVRAFFSFVRVLRLVRLLLLERDVRALLVFTSLSPSGVAEKALMCALGRLFGKRVVVSICSEIRRRKRFERLYGAIMKILWKSCHVVHCQSSAAAKNLQSIYGCNPERISILGNWIDASELLAIPRPDASEESAEGPRGRDGSNRPPNLLYLGWLQPYKGVFDLLEAAALLRGRGRRFRLRICGGGPEFDALVRRRDALELSDCVEIPGWVKGDAKRRAIEQADLFVLPSHTEGLPNALLEAMAAGLAVVVTPVGGIPDVVTDGRNGRVVPVQDPAALADAIDDLLGNPRVMWQMGVTNRDAIRANHAVEHVWKKFAAMLDVDFLRTRSSGDAEQSPGVEEPEGRRGINGSGLISDGRSPRSPASGVRKEA